MGEMSPITAHHSRLSPPWVAHRASRAASGRIVRYLRTQCGRMVNTCFTRGTLHAPDGETTQADPDIMGVAGQAPAAATRGLVCKLEADRQDKGEDELDTRFGVAQEGKVGRLIVEIDGDGAVFASRFGTLSHVSSPCRWPLVR